MASRNNNRRKEQQKIHNIKKIFKQTKKTKKMLEKKPESDQDMDRLLYFTKRKSDNGSVFAYVYRQKCPKCGKSLMGKPRDEEGNVKIRAKEYVCPSCGNSIEKKEYEES